MARRKVCQLVSVVLTVLVACADCVNLSAPSPVSGLTPCSWVLWTDPTPDGPEGASGRCALFPARYSQLVRQEPVGPPRFRASPSARATLFDPGRPALASPVLASAVLGSATVTSSPPALRLSRLNRFSGMRVPLAARACTLGTLLERSFGPIDLQVHRLLSFRRATLGLGWLAKPFHSLLSF